jgi:hypothetical protein
VGGLVRKEGRREGRREGRKENGCGFVNIRKNKLHAQEYPYV